MNRYRSLLALILLQDCFELSLNKCEAILYSSIHIKMRRVTDKSVSLIWKIAARVSATVLLPVRTGLFVRYLIFPFKLTSERRHEPNLLILLTYNVT